MDKCGMCKTYKESWKAAEKDLEKLLKRAHKIVDANHRLRLRVAELESTLRKARSDAV